MTPTPPTPVLPFGHVHCETFWRDTSPKPSPCWVCGEPTPIGHISDLFAILGTKPKGPTWGPFALGGGLP